MPLLDSALAFAITMLALSLACSAAVELIHRILGMRQAGFKYMLEQMFDQVLSRYVEPAIKAKIAADTKISDALKNQTVQTELKDAKAAFIQRMRANRAPMGVPPNATPEVASAAAAADAKKKPWRLGVWGGRELTELSPIGFMERLGTMDIGADIAKGAEATADSLDAALKDIAQKFDALGKDAADYFDGRARLLSVVVAVVFAFVVHASAIDLYKTFMQNPNATAAVIAQSTAIQARYKSAQAVTGDVTPAPSPAEFQKQAEDAEKAAQAVKAETEKLVKQFADLGVPLGWSDERIKAANMRVLVWTCKELPEGKTSRFGTLWQQCKPSDKGHEGPPEQYETVWFGLPWVLNVWFYLLLGGLLIGLGAPFWYNAVTTITNIRGGGSGGGGATGAASGSGAPHAAAMAFAASPQKAQPITPVGAFQVASQARPATPPAGPASGGTKTPPDSP